MAMAFHQWCRANNITPQQVATYVTYHEQYARYEDYLSELASVRALALNLGEKRWNVLVPVVEIIGAATGEQAISALRTRLQAAGFEPYDGGPASAFESEEGT